MNTINILGTTPAKALFEMHGSTLIVTVDGTMHCIDLYNEELKKWFQLTWDRNTKTDMGVSVAPFDDGSVTLSAGDWKQMFWVVMDNMLCETIETIIVDIDAPRTLQ